MSQVKITVSRRQAVALRKWLSAGWLSLTPDEQDAAEHALARLDRALAIHGMTSGETRGFSTP